LRFVARGGMAGAVEEPTSQTPHRDQFGKRLFWTLAIGGVISLSVGSALFTLNQGPLGASGAEGPGIVSATYTPLQPVNIWRNESWLAGKVLRVDGKRYLVEYSSAGVFDDEWVDASRLQPALSHP